jgi:hypothetical protein
MEIVAMKAFLPVAALVVLAGATSMTYSPKAVAHLNCTGLYNDCIASGEDPFVCGDKEAICWATNHWPDNVRAAVKDNEL